MLWHACVESWGWLLPWTQPVTSSHLHGAAYLEMSVLLLMCATPRDCEEKVHVWPVSVQILLLITLTKKDSIFYWFYIKKTGAHSHYRQNNIKKVKMKSNVRTFNNYYLKGLSTLHLEELWEPSKEFKKNRKTSWKQKPPAQSVRRNQVYTEHGKKRSELESWFKQKSEDNGNRRPRTQLESRGHLWRRRVSEMSSDQLETSRVLIPSPKDFRHHEGYWLAASQASIQSLYTSTGSDRSEERWVKDKKETWMKSRCCFLFHYPP